MRLRIKCKDCGKTLEYGIDNEYMYGHYIVSVYHEDCKAKVCK